MVTKEQAIRAGEWRTEFHYGECKKIVGPRGGVTIKQVRVRSNGKCKTWKTRPEEFSLPYAYGLYDHGYIDNRNCSEFHLESECPLNSLTDER
jgi:hypothetical protein